MSVSDETTPIRALRERVAAFVAARDWAQYHTPKNLAMAVACEAAELMEHYLWVENPPNRARVEAEVADIAICLLNFVNVVGIDLSAAVEAKLAEASAKYPADVVRGKPDKYSDY